MKIITDPTLYAKSALASNMTAADKLDPSVRVRSEKITSFGSVATAIGANGDKMPSSVTFTLNNSGGSATKAYVIGDPGGIIEDLMKETLANADSSSGGSVAGFNYSLGVAPLTVKAINYQSTSGAVQFPQRFSYAEADINGAFKLTPVNTPEFQRNTAYNANLLTLEFQNQFVLDWNRAFVITAGIGQTVAVTLLFGAAAYR